MHDFEKRLCLNVNHCEHVHFFNCELKQYQWSFIRQQDHLVEGTLELQVEDTARKKNQGSRIPGVRKVPRVQTETSVSTRRITARVVGVGRLCREFAN